MKIFLGMVLVGWAALASAQSVNPVTTSAPPQTFTRPLVDPGGALAPVNLNGAPNPPGGALASGPLGGMLQPAPIGGVLSPRPIIPAFAPSNVPSPLTVTNRVGTGMAVVPVIISGATTPAGGMLTGTPIGGTRGVIITGSGSATPGTGGTVNGGSGVIVTGGSPGGTLTPNGVGGTMATTNRP